LDILIENKPSGKPDDATQLHQFSTEMNESLICQFFNDFRDFVAGLPDFSWYMIPEPEKCTKISTNCHKIFLMSVK
jgi:hypothetical protein